MKFLPFFVLAVVVLLGSASALTYRYDGNKTFIISNDAGTIDYGEIQVLNRIQGMTFVDASPFQLDLQFRLQPYRNFSKPGGQGIDVFLDRISNRTGASIKAIRALKPFSEIERTYFNGNYTVWDANSSTWVMHFTLNHTDRVINGSRWVGIGDLNEIEDASNFVANRSYFFTLTLQRNASQGGNMDVQPIVWGLRFRELAWWNSTYTYCRDILNLNETAGMNVVNEPANHGNGFFVDTSGWANQPHINGLAIVDQPCGAGGNIIPFEITQSTTSASLYTSMRLVPFVNLTAYQNATYALYYSTTGVGRPFFNLTGNLAVGAPSSNVTTVTAGGFATGFDFTNGGSYTWTYLGFEYDNTNGGVYGYPTYLGTQATSYYAFNGGSPAGHVGCRFTYNSSMIAILNCTNDATAISIQYRRYATFGTGNTFVDFTYWPPAGGGNVSIRQDFANSQSVVRAQDAAGAYGSVTTSNLQPKNGAVGLNMTTNPAQGNGRVGLVMIQNNSRGATNIQLDTSGGGNSQVNFWNKGGSGNGVGVLNYTGDSRIGLYNQTNGSLAALDVAITNASSTFRNGIGANALMGAEQQNTGITATTPATNNTLAGFTARFNSSLTSISSLANATFVFDNGTGTFVNFTSSITGTANVTNFTANIAGPNSTIRIWVRICDNTGFCASSTMLTFTSKELTLPQLINPRINTTTAGAFALFQVNLSDDYALANATFELDNGTGTFYNYSIIAITGTVNVSNFTALLNSTGASTIRWRVYSCDFFGNCNGTSLQSFTAGGLGVLSTDAATYAELAYANLTVPYSSLSAGTVLSLNFTMLNQDGTINRTNYTTTVTGSGVISFLFNVGLTTVSSVDWRNFSVSGFINGVGITGTNTSALVSELIVTNCSPGSGAYVSFINFTVIDELTLTPVYNATLELFVNLTLFNSVPYSFQLNLTNAYNASLCISPGNANVSLTGVVQYTAAGYSVRNYYLTGQFTNSTTFYTLFLLLNTSSSEVDFSLKDIVGNPISGYILQIQRYFVASNSYQVVAQAVTDYAGRTYTYLYQPANSYRIIVENAAGIPVETFSPVIISSALLTGTLPNGNGIYSIELTLGQSSNPIYDQIGSLSVACSFNNVTTVLQCTVIDSTQQATQSVLNLNNLTGSGWTQICHSTATGPASTLTCTIGSGWNLSVFNYQLLIYNSNGQYYTAYSDTLDFRTTSPISWGTSGFLMTLFIVLVCAAIGASNAPTMLVMIGVGFIVSWIIGAFAVGFGSLIGILCILGILAWSMRN